MLERARSRDAAAGVELDLREGDMREGDMRDLVLDEPCGPSLPPVSCALAPTLAMRP
jgi:hypothetical protein